MTLSPRMNAIAPSDSIGLDRSVAGILVKSELIVPAMAGSLMVNNL
jgi:hypothetical protein